MKKYIKFIYKAGGLGVLIGLLASLGFSLAYHINYLPSSPAFVAHFANSSVALGASIILWFLMGVTFGLDALIFKIDSWSLLKQTVVHAIITYVGSLTFAMLFEWFPINALMLLIFTMIFILIYVIMWKIQMHMYQREIKAINLKLK